MTLNLLKPKYLIKILWFAFGLAGAVIVVKQYFPDLLPKIKNSNLVKGIQTELVQTAVKNIDNSIDDSETQENAQTLGIQDLKNLDPQQAGKVIGKVVSDQITEFIKETKVEIKQYPAKQVKKIKIGACEELLEEDICSIAEEIQCNQSSD